MYLTSITSANDADPANRRLTLTEDFRSVDRPSLEMIREWLAITEDCLRETFPRGMTYAIPSSIIAIRQVFED